jgi:hypothetical protein
MPTHKAPPHTSAIHFSTGRTIDCDKNGFLTAPDDLTQAEIETLRREGFEPVPVPPVTDAQTDKLLPPVTQGKTDKAKT